MNKIALETSLSLLILSLHAWIMLGHRQKMGSESDDRPQDPIFSKMKQSLSIYSILLIHVQYCYRRILISNDKWDPQNIWERFLDFGAIDQSEFGFYLGIVIFFAGVALRIWSIKILGRLFTFEIGIRKEHNLIEEGPYRILRHPSYTGYLIMLVGAGLTISNIIGLISMIIPVVFFFVLRMSHEEKMLNKHFGAKYAEYQSRTKRIIPFIY